MSQSETYVPGMNAVGGQNAGNGLYSRQTAQVANNNYSGNGTYIPGMQDNAPEAKPVRKTVEGEAVVGFLYSISRMGIGEYWPLHLGANTIGRAANCDVQLKEASVSESHATISIKRMKSTNALIASVRDTGSKNGMYLNDEELDYDNHSCKNGDVLTVGSCYRLLVMLVNASEYGLSVAEDFVPVEEQAEADAEGVNFDDTYTRGQHRGYADDGTVDLSGNRNFAAPGETKIM